MLHGVIPRAADTVGTVDDIAALDTLVLAELRQGAQYTYHAILEQVGAKANVSCPALQQHGALRAHEPFVIRPALGPPPFGKSWDC